MNKELEALNKVKKFKDDCCMFGSSDIEIDRELDIIETALKRLESIEDTRFIILGGRMSGKSQKLNALLKLKAFEIIREKGIDIDALKYHKDLEHYNFSLRGRYEQLTKEEYDLLKEVL